MPFFPCFVVPTLQAKLEKVQHSQPGALPPTGSITPYPVSLSSLGHFGLIKSIGDVSGGWCSSLVCCLPGGSGRTWQIIVWLYVTFNVCRKRCENNGKRARRSRLSQSFSGKAVHSLAVHHILRYTPAGSTRICTCINGPSNFEIEDNSIIIQDLFAVCLEHCFVMPFSRF